VDSLRVYARRNRRSHSGFSSPTAFFRSRFTLVNDALGFKRQKILRDLPGPEAAGGTVLYDSSRTTAFVVKKGQAVTMPDANAFASIGFSDVSTTSRNLIRSPLFRRRLPFFYMVERAYPSPT